ncbi:MAG: hypothetical protein NVSMB6_17910 [Burkholderiaceae bacterium]
MKNICMYVMMAGMSACLATAADAADSGGKVNGGDRGLMDRHKGSPERIREHLAQRQAALHDKLKLSPAQEPAWKTFIAESTPNAVSKQQETDPSAMQNVPAPERLERHLALSRQRDARLSARLVALKKFYAVLTPEQRKTFDLQTLPRGGRHERDDSVGPQKN